MDYAPFPSFSSDHLPIWFAQMESAFALNGILEESEKYDYVLIYIPSDALRMVEDIILNPPTDDKYEHIKYEFIKRIVIKKLMEVKFGNEIPSQYLRKLKEIAGQRLSNEEILNVWLNNLPEKVRQIVSLGNSTNMDKLCEIADKTIVLVTPNPQSTTSTQPQLKEELSQKEWCEMMKRRMEKLSKQLEQYMGNDKYEEVMENGEQISSIQKNMLKVPKEAFNIFNWNRNTCSSPKTICWYHTNFGDKAIACVAPCQYKFCPTVLHFRK